MAESRTNLNIGLGSGASELPEKERPQARRQASDADRQAFEQALSGPGEEAAESDQFAESAVLPGLPRLPKPFTFFSDTARPDDACTGAARDMDEQSPDAADRPLTSDGGSGRRETRADLKSGVLPGLAGFAHEEAAGADQAPTAPVAASGLPPDLPRPFAFFSEPLRSGEACGDVPHGLARQLSDIADRLLVGDGSSGRREVRIDLKAEVLPGVSMSIYEEAARLVVEFTCVLDASRDTLCRCAQPLADQLADSLHRMTMVRVHMDDPDDLRPFEAAGAAG